jgi:hypothetical protein
MISRVYQQIVNGKNFRIFFTLRGSNDVYEIKIFVPLPFSNALSQIVYIKRNNIDFKPTEPNVNPISGSETIINNVAQYSNNANFIAAQREILKVYPEFANAFISKIT